jgi:hypothetical protein
MRNLACIQSRWSNWGGAADVKRCPPYIVSPRRRILGVFQVCGHDEGARGDQSAVVLRTRLTPTLWGEIGNGCGDLPSASTRRRSDKARQVGQGVLLRAVGPQQPLRSRNVLLTFAWYSMCMAGRVGFGSQEERFQFLRRRAGQGPGSA